MLKRNSSENMPTTVDMPAPELKKAKSTETSKSVVELIGEVLAAWGKGEFSTGDVDAALAKYYTTDVLIDASPAAHSGVAMYKKHNGFTGVKDWFDWVASFKLEDMEVSMGAGEKENICLLRMNASATYTATGKSAFFSAFQIFEFEGEKIAKQTFAVYNPAAVAAIISTEDVPIPPAVELPSFSPHANPLEPYGEKMALWGAGEFLKAEVRREHLVPDCVDDLTDGALPSVLKPYVGIDGTGEWMEHMASTWDMSNLVIGTPIVGLKAGCVTTSMTFDVKHKGTGKEAQGVQMWNEFAYNAAGKFVYARHFFINAPLIASIYSGHERASASGVA